MEVCVFDVDDICFVLDDFDFGLRFIGKGDKECIVLLGSYVVKVVDVWLIRGCFVWVEIGNGEYVLLFNICGWWLF